MMQRFKAVLLPLLVALYWGGSDARAAGANATSAVEPAAAGWQRLFNDDFGGSALKADKWEYQIGTGKCTGPARG